MVNHLPTIGILALQGAFREHRKAIERCGAPAVLIKKAEEVDLVDGLIIPGGESTTIGKLMAAYGLIEPIKRRAREGMAVFGTCAGLILMGRETVEATDYLLDIVDIKARRNAYGRQVDSFEADIIAAVLGPAPLRAVFIRAPWIESVGPGVRVLAVHAGHPVLAEQGAHLACAFHPELTDDLRVHRYFLDKLRRIDGGRQTADGRRDWEVK